MYPPRLGNRSSHLGAGKVSADSWLRTLSYLDYDRLTPPERVDIDSEPGRCPLDRNHPAFGDLLQQTALSRPRDDVGRVGCLCNCEVRDPRKRPEGHVAQVQGRG